MDKVKTKIDQRGLCSRETKFEEGVNVMVMCVNKARGGYNSAMFRDVDP